MLHPFDLKYGSSPMIPVLVFCLDDLSYGESWVLKSPIIITLFSVSPYRSTSIYLVYLGTPI